MSKRNEKPVIRNVIVIAMTKRYPRQGSPMKDRRAERGGTKNRQREFLADRY